jgi:GNAT superfamily N-acetyltransferase
VSLDLQRVDVADLAVETSGELAEIHNAALEGVPLRRHTDETFRLDCVDHGSEGPLEGLWIARLDGATVGYAGLHLNRYENLDGAKITGAVHPSHQRRGIGRVLMETAEAATDRPRLRAPVWVGTAGERALPALGYSARGSHEVRRLSLREAPPADLQAAVEAASAAYDLERFSGRCPDTLLAEMQVLRETINDAPEPEPVEFEAYPPERIRRYEESLAFQHQTPYTIVARHRETGKAAGLTLVCIHESRPQIAAQEDTSVVAAHRGHRLGLRMKLAMLDWLRAERPDVDSVDTWNAPGNAPMIAINEALGCTLVARTLGFRKER